MDGLRGLVHPKIKILSLITHPHVVPTILELSYDVFDEFWELSDPP